MPRIVWRSLLVYFGGWCVLSVGVYLLLAASSLFALFLWSALLWLSLAPAVVALALGSQRWPRISRLGSLCLPSVALLLSAKGLSWPWEGEASPYADGISQLGQLGYCMGLGSVATLASQRAWQESALARLRPVAEWVLLWWRGFSDAHVVLPPRFITGLGLGSTRADLCRHGSDALGCAAVYATRPFGR